MTQHIERLFGCRHISGYIKLSLIQTILHTCLYKNCPCMVMRSSICNLNYSFHQGSSKNYVDKRMQVVGKGNVKDKYILLHKKNEKSSKNIKMGWVGVQKRQKSCQRSFWMTPYLKTPLTCVLLIISPIGCRSFSMWPSSSFWAYSFLRCY